MHAGAEAGRFSKYPSFFSFRCETHYLCQGITYEHRKEVQVWDNSDDLWNVHSPDTFPLLNCLGKKKEQIED